MDDPVLDDLRRRLAGELGFELVEARPLELGHPTTNRIVRLRAADGREAIAKQYHRDARRRLEREFGALSTLRQQGIERVPTPLLRSDAHYYGVYSREPGAVLAASAYTVELASQLGGWAATLTRVRPEGAELPLAIGATFSLAGRVERVRGQLGGFRDLAADGGAPAAVRALCAEIDPVAAVERALARAIAGTGDVPLDIGDLRLTSGDFGPHNVLVASDRSARVLDFESSGWDHPLALCVDFLTHDQSLGLGEAAGAAFLAAFQAGADLPPGAFAAFERTRVLMHVFWCAVHLSSVDPAHLARRRFLRPGLDVEAHAAEQMAKFRRRLDLVDQLLG